MLFEPIAAVLFVCSSGILFGNRFRDNKFLNAMTGVIALFSTYFLIAQLAPVPAWLTRPADVVSSYLFSVVHPQRDPPVLTSMITPDEARNVVSRYLAAWQRGDVDTQASLLSENFTYIDQQKTQDRTSYLQQKRRLALRYLGAEGHISIITSDVQVQVSPYGATVTYTQKYDSPVYWSVGRNQFELHTVGGIIKITAERFSKIDSGVHS